MDQPAIFNPDTPFDLPPLPPTAEIETVEVFKRLVGASRSLAALNQVARLLADQNLLINLIPILESKSSSEIENIVTTTDELFKHSNDVEKADPATKETLRYKQALFTGFASLQDRPLCVSTAIQVCSELTGSHVDIRKVTGTNLKNQRTGEVIYTPPVGEDVIRNKLSNWEHYAHYSEIDPLIALAIAHYQFEAIHPFLDGNGRTGRILNILYLIEKGMLSQPILYLSRFIVQNKDEYYKLLLDVSRNQDWEPWVCFMLDAIKITADWTFNKVNAVVELQKQTESFIQSEIPKNYSHELVSLLFENPYVRVRNLKEKGILGSRQAAMTTLKKLEQIGILESKQVGRETLFINTRLLFLMTNDINDFEPFT
ncbi:hypothetical protein CTH30272_03071 [Allocatenococcus thiocycli]|nr:hypothetical protein CTH30272_03071 [Catenococcus thiocycli]